jgi:hypothetical protein
MAKPNQKEELKFLNSAQFVHRQYILRLLDHLQSGRNALAMYESTVFRMPEMNTVNTYFSNADDKRVSGVTARPQNDESDMWNSSFASSRLP